jgi:RHS repeat-associated protein
VSHVNAWTATQAGAVAAFTAQGTAVPGSDLELRYSYDYADRRIRRSMDADGLAGVGQASVSFAAYAGDVRTLEIAQTATVSASGRVIGLLGQVVERNFYGNDEDEILAVDKITWTGSTPTTSTFWTFADHQGTIRDIVSGNAANRGQVVEHRQYDSFGKVLARTANLSPGAATLPGSGVGVGFGYTGRPIDEKTGLSDYRARWYDANVGRFINEDPSGFAGGDTNLFRYVGNDPLDRVDPSGLTSKWAGYGGKGSVPAAGWGAYGTGGLMSVSEFGRLSGSLGSQPSSENAAPKSSSQFMASATQLFMQHFTGKPGVHDLYSEKGFPVSARSVDSSGATREYKFADGTRYMEPTEPSTAQYADGASLAFAPLRVAKQGGSALRVAGSAAGNVVDYAASNYASRRASEATGGYLAMMPAPVTALLTGRRGGAASLGSALDDGAAVRNNASAAAHGVTGAAENFAEGSFSITKQGWRGYPEGIPQPQGPFRILTGAEYEAARKAANQANQAIRKADPDSLVGKEIHEIKPVKFGGSPTDPSNKTPLQASVHRQQATPWWNSFLRALQGK